MTTIPRAPPAPPATSPDDPRYYDARDLEQELLRTFQICHECRMCVNYCGAFPELFKRIDRAVDAGAAQGAESIDAADIRAVSDECWQCKLCFIKCPYTKDEGAHELLDFPRLMAREKAARAARDGVALVDRLLGEPDTTGRLAAGWRAPLANLIHESRLLRKVQEKVTGISAEFPLPRFAAETFPEWMRRHRPADGAGDAGEVVLFATCYNNFNTPAVARAAVRVLEHIGFRVSTVSEQCCGMPNLDGGDVARATAKIRANVAALVPRVRAGALVLVPSPTCGYTMRREWPEYLREPEVREVAAAVRDVMEFLEERRKHKELPSDGLTSLGRVGYHAACHLRAQKIGFPAARLLAKHLPETQVRTVQECSAVDGTWGMKAAHYHKGVRYAERLLDGLEEARPEVVLSDCPLSMLRIAKESGRMALHPIEALAQAYGLSEPENEEKRS
jgi:glycerol-3-phosphate dehydrogenase subunit C